MATTQSFAYNTGSLINGTIQSGDFAIGTPTSGYTNTPQFWNGPDEELGYVIAQPVPAGNQPNPVGSPAYLGFFRTDGFSDSAFIDLASAVAGQVFSTTTDAYNWLDTNGYYTTFNPIPASLLVYLDTGNVSSYPGFGSVWYDLTSNNNDATLINSPTYSATFNGILQFDDVSLEYATIPNIGNLTNWTVETWFRLTTSLNGKVTSIVSNQFDLVNKLNFSLGTNNAPINYNLASGFYDGAWRTTTGLSLATNTWYQAVGTYDGSVIRQYINGSASGGTVNYVGTPQSGGEVRLMRRWDSPLTAANLVDGDLAIVKIYNTALTAGEISESFNNNKARFGI